MSFELREEEAFPASGLRAVMSGWPEATMESLSVCKWSHAEGTSSKPWRRLPMDILDTWTHPCLEQDFIPQVSGHIRQ